jgi:hypothetical protein
MPMSRSSPMPADYAALIEALADNDGQTTYALSVSVWRPRPMPARRPMMQPSPTGLPRLSRSRCQRYRSIGGVLKEKMRYGENPHQKRRLLRHRRQPSRGRDGNPAPGQAALLQQHQRHGRRLRARGRIPAGKRPGLRDHQACQSLRRGHRIDASKEAYASGRSPVTAPRPSAASSRSTRSSTPKRLRKSSSCSRK